MSIKLPRIGFIFRLVRSLFAIALFLASSSPSRALAQTANDPWSDPVNLSNSGLAINPDIVVDSDGVAHAVWQNDMADYLYSRFDGDQWSTPELTNLNRLFRFPDPDEAVDPLQLANYTGANPLFLASPNQRIFAFWISPDGRVYVSNVANADFNDYAAWGSGRLITPGAASFAAALDGRGQLHLAFLSTEGVGGNSPGIYYMHSLTSGGDWSQPVLLHGSPYFRTLSRGEAQLSLATAGREEAVHVYITWDHRPRKQVFLARSIDGGETWEEPTQIASSIPGSGLAGPFHIRVGANRNSVVLVWQNGQPGGSCSQMYQSSSNAGATWSEPQPMIEELVGCAQSNLFMTGSTDNPRVPPQLYLLTEAQSQVFITAWNGLQWSRSQAQPILAGFEEPEIYTEVIYGCRRSALFGERLYFIGCDQGEGGDVWVTSRDLGANQSWFEPPVWSELLPVTTTHPAIETIEMATSEDGLIHALFSQGRDPAIYYTYWNGELWSRIAPVLVMPEGEAGRPAIAAGPGNELFLLAPNETGTLYFTRAASGNAAAASGWSPPIQLETVHNGEIGSVNVALDAAGTINVVYSVPVNENRGIYLIQSEDGGNSWSEPLQVFNGAATGFDIVGAPSLLILPHGVFHVLWKEQLIEGDGVPHSLSLYYTRSEDGGRTFSEVTLVVEEPVAWREMATDHKSNLHLLWQPEDMMTTVWDQASPDGGRSWDVPQGVPNEGMTSTAFTDPVGRLHLINAAPTSLGHWLWDGSRWLPEEPLRLSLDSQQGAEMELIEAAINQQGKMVVVMTIQSGTGTAAETSILYSTRTLELPQEQIPDPEDTPPMLPTPTGSPATATPETLFTPTTPAETEQANSDGPANPNESNNSVSPFAIALVPVALLLLSMLGIVIWRVTRPQDR